MDRGLNQLTITHEEALAQIEQAGIIEANALILDLGLFIIEDDAFYYHNAPSAATDGSPDDIPGKEHCAIWSC